MKITAENRKQFDLIEERIIQVMPNEVIEHGTAEMVGGFVKVEAILPGDIVKLQMLKSNVKEVAYTSNKVRVDFVNDTFLFIPTQSGDIRKSKEDFIHFMLEGYKPKEVVIELVEIKPKQINELD